MRSRASIKLVASESSSLFKWGIEVKILNFHLNGRYIHSTMHITYQNVLEMTSG